MRLCAWFRSGRNAGSGSKLRDWNLSRQKITVVWPLFGILILIGTVGCLPTLAVVEEPSPTPEPTETATPTPTIVWFPPTATWTPAPTLNITPSPTPRLLPDVGALILADDFSTETSWQLISSAGGNVAMGNNRLNIAISTPRTLLASLHSEAVLSDFYLEITARTGLCSGLDEYGILLRAASEADFFRFSLSCNGQTRLDKVIGGSASSPIPWTLSGVVPPGAPGVAQLAIWASGKEMRFFINGEHQFTINDSSLLSGRIGVFARSSADSTVSVSFSDLAVYAVTP